MSKSTKKSSTVAVVLKKPAARPSGTPWPVLYKRLKDQGQILHCNVKSIVFCLFVLPIGFNTYRISLYTCSALSVAPQGEIDRARIAELTSQLTSAANDNDKLKEKLRDVVADRNRLHDECMMHNAGGLAMLSGEVPARRRC